MRLRTPAIAAIAVSLAAAPASAHITANPSQATAGQYAKFDFRVGHGCEESPTTAVTIQIPEGIHSATPEVNPGWRITRTMEALTPPVDDGHGGQITERVASITWTGGPLDPLQLTEFGLSVKLPEAGGSLTFPTVQRCEDGVTRWIEPVEDGEEEPEHPVPTVTLTAGGGGDAPVAEEPAGAESADAANGPGDGKVNAALGLGIGGLVVGAAGLGVGLMGRTRRRD